MAKRASRYTLVIDADGKTAIREIGKVEKSLEDADDEVKALGDGGQLDGLLGSLNDVDVSAKGLASSLASGGPAGAAVALGAGLVFAADAAADAAIEADVLATALDTDVETASKLVAVFKRVGIESNDIADIGLQIAGGMADNAELAERLGTTLSAVQDPVEALRAGIDGWDLLSATERATLFGEEGVRQISAIIAQGGSLEDLLNDVGSANVIDEDDVRKARELKAQVADLKQQWDGIALTIGQAALPVLTLFGDQIERFRVSLEDFPSAVADIAEWTANVTGLTSAYGLLTDAAGGLGYATDDTLDLADATIDLADDVGASAKAVDAAGKRWQAMATDATGGLSEIDRALAKSKSVLEDWKGSLEIGDKTAAMSAAIDAAFSGATDDIRTAQDATIDWLEELDNVPAEQITKIRTSFDEGDLAAVYAEIENIRRQAGIPLQPQYNPPVRYQPGRPDGGNYRSTTNLTVNMPRSATPRSTAAEIDRWRGVNG